MNYASVARCVARRDPELALENRGILPRPTVRYPYLVLIAYHGVPDIELSVPKIPNVGDAIILPPKGPGVAPDILRVTDVVLESHGSKNRRAAMGGNRPRFRRPAGPQKEVDADPRSGVPSRHATRLQSTRSSSCPSAAPSRPEARPLAQARARMRALQVSHNGKIIVACVIAATIGIVVILIMPRG